MKRSSSFFAALCLCLSLFGGTYAEAVNSGLLLSDEPSVGSQYSPDSEAGLSEIKLYADGLLTDRGFLRGETAYVSVDALCAMCGISIEQSCDDGVLNVSSPVLELRAEPGTGFIEANKRYCYCPEGFIFKNGRCYLPLNAVEWIFGVKTGLSDGRAELSTEGMSIIRGSAGYYDRHYSFEDIYWLSHIISAEAVNLPIEAKIGVGNVVLNRVKSSLYPNSVYEVVFDSQNAIQFTPTLEGRVINNPSAESVIAAYLSLEGFNTVGGSMYFIDPTQANDYWVRTAKKFVITIDCLDFYAEKDG